MSNTSSTVSTNASINTPTDLFLDLQTQRSHVLDWGGPSDAPTVLLIHGLGLTSNAQAWNLLAPILAQNMRVVALDQRSHGQTEAPSDNDFSFEALSGDLHQVCRHLGIRQPILVGHSWGGDAVLQYAARYADSVAGAVALDGGFVGMNKVMTWPQAEAVSAPAHWAGISLVAFRDEVKQLWGDLYSAEIFDIIMASFELRSDQTIAPHLSFENQLRIARAVWEQDADELYGKVKCPTLFLPCLAPEPHDSFIQQFLAWKRMKEAHIKVAMPHAQIDWLTDSIHDVQLQHPEAIAKNIVEFVQSTT